MTIFNNHSSSFSLLPSPVAGAVVCHDLTMGILLPSNLTMSCLPVASCSTPPENLALIWQIRYTNLEQWTDLDPGYYTPPPNTELVSEDDKNFITISPGGTTLNINDMTVAMIGYYRVVRGNMEISTFTVFRESLVSIGTTS